MADFDDLLVDTAFTPLESHTPDTGTGWTGSGDAGALWISSTGADGAAQGGKTGYVTSDDLGADHETIARRFSDKSSSDASAGVASRIQDINNCVFMWYAGTGGAGRRLSKIVGGTKTDLITSTGGTSDEWIKTVCNGTTLQLWEGGTGTTPGTWTQVGTDQTLSTFSTEHAQGLRNNGIGASLTFVSRYQANGLGGGGGTTISLTTASLSLTANALTPASALSMGAGSIGFTANAAELSFALALGAASISLVGQAITLLGATVISLAAATLNFSPQPVLASITLNLANASISMAGNAVTVTQNRLLQLGVALLNFAGRRITVTAAGVASIFSTLLITWRRRGRR